VKKLMFPSGTSLGNWSLFWNMSTAMR